MQPPRPFRTIFAAILLAVCAASARGQTIKSLGYNTTNGQVVAATNITFTNAIGFTTNAAAETRNNLFTPNAPLTFDTNGQVQWTNTNALTFTNRFRQSSDNATNPPEFRLVTKSNAVASIFYYDAFGSGAATNPVNDKDWSVLFIGNNHVASGNGQDRARANGAVGAISLTIENMYYAELPQPSHVGEFYINIDDYTTNGSGTTRSLFIIGSQTNSVLGQALFAYPLQVNYSSNSIAWATGSAAGGFGLSVSSTNSGQAARLIYSGTNASQSVLFRMQVQDAATDMFATRSTFYIRNYEAGRNALRLNSNGVVLGATDANLNPAAPVHLAGNTRIDGAISFNNTTNASITRTNLGLGWSALTNTNAQNFYTSTLTSYSFISAAIADDAGGVRDDIGLGEGSSVRFGGITNDGNITINQWNATNGLLFIYRTNNESFLGLANLIASNNTTVGNETLFRVGVAETTNKAAQFGFRATNTNGTGVAVFSLWGNNALCMIGADASGNAVISSGNPTNEVMTLIVDGATEFARPIRFSTNAASKPSTNAPANTTNVAAWVEFRIGTNSYRAPLYQ